MSLSSDSHVLHHNVLMWNQTVHPVVPTLPPVFRGPQVQQQGGSLLERQLSGAAAHVVKFGYGLDLFHLCNGTVYCYRYCLLTLTYSITVRDSPSSLVFGPVPLSTSSRAPGSLWGLSLMTKIKR